MSSVSVPLRPLLSLAIKDNNPTILLVPNKPRRASPPVILLKETSVRTPSIPLQRTKREPIRLHQRPLLLAT